MNEEQKRIAIAEACGWKRTSQEVWVSGGPHFMVNNPNFWWVHLPDFFRDLNACHEMEKVLTPEQCLEYHAVLNAIQASDSYERSEEYEHPAEEFWFHATAPQRAEAFGKTLGLW